MSLTALAFLAIFFGGLVLAFYRPLFGLGVYVWTFYANPASAWWGQDLPDLRWSMSAAVVTLIAYLLVGRPAEAGTPPLKGAPASDPSAMRARADSVAW